MTTPEKETPTPKTVEEMARELGHEIIAAIKDFQENGKGTLWLDQIILKHLLAQNQAADERLREVVDALEWVLPMAKGYAHSNDVGRNKEIIQHAQAIAAKHGITNL